MMTVNDIQKQLWGLRDEKYAKFQSSLLPNIGPGLIIGVRIPLIRQLARQLSEQQKADFIAELPHKYYEENILHSAILGRLKDFDQAVCKVCRFLKYVDNWAVCDTLSPAAFAKEPERLLPYIERWMGSDEPYTVRFGIGMLMRYFLDERFEPQYLHQVAAIRSEGYYVKMMQAWFMATAIAKQYEETLKIFLAKELDPWVHNRSIQKARESFRVPLEHKNYLTTLKI